MKKILFLMIFSIAANLSVLKAQDLAVNKLHTGAETAATALGWDKQVHDFGKIPQGIPAKATFTMTNNGNEPVLITEVKTTCGCTAAGYSKEPILPGESTTIDATYNAKKEGLINKTIKVYTSLNDEVVLLKIKGEVVKEQN